MKYEKLAINSEYSFKWSVCVEMVKACSKTISTKPHRVVVPNHIKYD